MAVYLVIDLGHDPESADDLRDTILDGWGFPLSIENDPSLLQVRTFEGVDGSLAKQLQRSMELNARMVTRLRRLRALCLDDSEMGLLVDRLDNLLKDEDPTW